MQVFSDLSLLSSFKNSCVTIGNFDGLHLGHKVLIDGILEEKEKNQFLDIVITFWPHPRKILYSNREHFPITTREYRLYLLKKMGVSTVLELPFDEKLSRLSAEDFVKQYLLNLNIKTLIIGHDFALGRGRSGHAGILKNLSNKFNFSIKVKSPVYVDGELVSSSSIRQYLKVGDIQSVNKLLGRPFGFSGRVIHGDGRGSKIGYPTANIELPDSMVPANGVYATKLTESNGESRFSVTNIGIKPTFDGQCITIESFLLNFNETLYDKIVHLEFLGRIRAERKFSSVNELVLQIAKDIDTAKNFFK